jgi:hypothetical protein
MRRWLFWLCLLGAVPLGVWLYDRVFLIYWVGHADVEVELRVADAATGLPVGGAMIEVHSDGTSCPEREPLRFGLEADHEGSARYLCRDCRACGIQSALGFRESSRAFPPLWKVRVAAVGYRTSAWIQLAEPRFARSMQQVRPGAAQLVVHISLFAVPG